VDYSKLSGHEFKVQEMEQQVSHCSHFSLGPLFTFWLHAELAAASSA
jgi:hypothetical protein